MGDDIGSLEMVLSILVLVPTAMLALFGVVWTPVGAIICAVIARSKGLSPGRYAMIGALYSVLSFLPWVYLVFRMLNGRISNLAIRLVYIVLYGMVWPAGFVLAISILAYEEAPYATVVIWACLLFSGAALVITATRMMLWHSAYPRRTTDDMLIDYPYLLPFAYPPAAVLFLVATLFIAALVVP